MIAVILAAGRGSRLRELTAAKPKCLTELAGEPLLRIQCKSLQAAGAQRIIVVRGYAAECLTPEAAGLEPSAFETVDNPRWQQGNMLLSLLCAAPLLEQAFSTGEQEAIISYADIAYPPEHLHALGAARQDIALTYDTLWEDLWRLRFTDPLSDAETFKQDNGLLCEIGGKPDSIAEVQGQYMGLLRLTPAGLHCVLSVCAALGDAAAQTDMTAFLRGLLQKNIPVGAVPVAGCWCEVDSPEDLHRYHEALNNPDWPHDWRRIAATP